MSPRPPRPAVCVTSFHPLLFPIVQELLGKSDFELAEHRLPADPAAQRSGPPVPRASLYIVEAHLQVSLTEAAIEKISSLSPAAPLLVIGEKFDEKNAFSLLRLRVRGLVTFADASAQLERAVKAVSNGGFWLPRSLLTRFVEVTISEGHRNVAPGAAVDLTHRERQVLDALLGNLSNKEIAHKLGITERGAKFHVSNLLRKHHVRRRADLILIFLTSR